MDKVEKKRYHQCLFEGCPNAHFNKCKVFWGVKCNRQGGKKIPILKSKYELEMDRLFAPISSLY